MILSRYRPDLLKCLIAAIFPAVYISQVTATRAHCSKISYPAATPVSFGWDSTFRVIASFSSLVIWSFPRKSKHSRWVRIDWKHTNNCPIAGNLRSLLLYCKAYLINVIIISPVLETDLSDNAMTFAASIHCTSYFALFSYIFVYLWFLSRIGSGLERC